MYSPIWLAVMVAWLGRRERFNCCKRVSIVLGTMLGGILPSLAFTGSWEMWDNAHKHLRRALELKPAPPLRGEILKELGQSEPRTHS